MDDIPGSCTHPECRRKLVGRNMYHSCSDATVEDFLRRAGPEGRALCDKFESMITARGPYYVSPAKSRISFMARVRFAGVSAVRPRGMTCGFALPRPIDNPRLRESYRLMGMQERLHAPARRKPSPRRRRRGP